MSVRCRKDAFEELMTFFKPYSLRSVFCQPSGNYFFSSDGHSRIHNLGLTQIPLHSEFHTKLSFLPRDYHPKYSVLRSFQDIRMSISL
jgi:hypothetical protein